MRKGNIRPAYEALRQLSKRPSAAPDQQTLQTKILRSWNYQLFYSIRVVDLPFHACLVLT